MGQFIGVHLSKVVCRLRLLRDLLHSVMCFLLYQYIDHYQSAMSETCITNQRNYELSILKGTEFTCIYIIIFSRIFVIYKEIYDIRKKKKSQHVWNFLLILKGTLSHSHKENWALSGNFKRYFVMNMVLSIKKNCIFFPTICGSNSDTRMSTNVDGCDAFHFCNRWINCNTDSTGVEQSAGGAGFLEGGEWENI